MNSFLSSKTHRQVLIGALALPLLSILFIEAALAAAADDIDQRFDVEPGGLLIIDSDAGEIEVSTWDRNEVRIQVSFIGEYEVDIQQSGNDVLVYAEAERGFWRGRGRSNIRFQAQVPEQYNLELDTGGGHIEVGPISGNVSADTSGGHIEVGDVSNGDVDVDTSGGRIRVGNVTGSVIADTSGGSITIGNVSGSVEADTSGGSIRIGDVEGDIYADTSGGNIEVGRSGGEVHLDTSGGSIRAGLAQGPIYADTSGGNIRLEGSRTSVEADTSGGNIEIAESGGEVYAESSGGSLTIRRSIGPIRAETAGGRIDAELLASDEDRDATVELETAGGDISMRIPANHAATILADLEMSRRGRGRYEITSDFDLDIEESDDSIIARGDINGGGDLIYLETTNSDIRIIRSIE